MTQQYNDMEKLFDYIEKVFDPYEHDPRIIFKYRLTGNDFWPSSQRIFLLALIGSKTFDLMFEPGDSTVDEEVQQIIETIEASEPLTLNQDAKAIHEAIETLITRNNIMPYELIKVRDKVNKFESIDLLNVENQGVFKP